MTDGVGRVIGAGAFAVCGFPAAARDNLQLRLAGRPV